jgi:hypothetical protein
VDFKPNDKPSSTAVADESFGQNMPTTPSILIRSLVFALTSTVASSALWAQSINVSLSPSTATVSVGQTFQFTAKVTPGSKSSVTWNVNGIAGGNTTVGTIASSGLYMAPVVSPSPSSVTVSVISTADPTISADATVTVVSNGPSVTVSPSTASMQLYQTKQFTATVSGLSNTSVTWSVNGVTGGDSAIGTVSTSGLYTAPAAVPSSIVTIAATSVADSSRSGQAAVTVIVPTLTISPSATSVSTSQSTQFSVVQTGGGSKKPATYTWSVNGIQGGNSILGTISNKGVYTAPSVPPSPAKTTIMAISNTNQSGLAGVTVVATVSVSVSPGSASVLVSRTQQFISTVSGTPNTGVSWLVNGVAGGNSTHGTVSSSGLYTAPPGVPTPSNVSVTAVSVADTTKTAAAAVTVTAPAVAITTSSLPDGKVDVAYSSTLAATGGTTPYTWSILSGQLPPGVGLGTSTGIISGTPSVAGTYNVTMAVTDAIGQQIWKALSVVIATGACTGCAPLTITTTSLPGGTVGMAYSATLSSTGGTPPVIWTVSSGQLPNGLGLSSGGSIAGTPSSVGSYTFVAQATDLGSATASQSFTLGVSASPSGGGAKAGGLTSYPSSLLSPNILSNPGFESGLTSWTPNNGLTLDSAVSHSGSTSVSLVDATQIQYTAEIDQDASVSPGIYRFGGWVKLSGVGTNSVGSGVRICLSAPVTQVLGCTDSLSGTADWAYYEIDSIVISQAQKARVGLQGYAVPNGTAWFDDVFLIQEQRPLSVFMKYPNYRGIIFSDQSQTAQFDVAVTPPIGAVGDYTLTASVVDEASSVVVGMISHPAVAHEVVSFDFTGFDPTHTFAVTFTISGADPSTNYSYPAYRLSMMDGISKSSMTVSVDSQNRFLLRGVPTFLLGVYDDGIGYTTDSATWQNLLTNEKRLFQLPINIYHNYWYGGASNDAMLSLMDVLGQHGIYHITTSNCFSTYSATGNLSFWFNYDTPQNILSRGAHPYFAGYYAADECVSTLASDVLVNNYQRMQTQDAGGIVLGTLVADSNIPLWRDSVDVLASDPYPMYGPEPAGGYPFYQVSDGTMLTKNTVMGSRPIMEVIQYFQFTSLGRWPTSAELRNMSYMAIADGANGLLYWSLGDGGGLYYVCDGTDAYHSPSGSSSWCQAKVDLFQELIDITTELSGLQPALSALDDNTSLVGNSQQASIHTRVKTVGNTSYLIASNVTKNTVTPTFTWGSVPTSIVVNTESRSIPVVGPNFTDTFAPYAAHVYQIQ